MPLVAIKSDPRARLKPCLRCGYSLRNNIDARACPECGLAVWISLGGNDDLDMSSPPWLGRLSLAAIVLAAANVALMVGVAVIQLNGAFPNLFPQQRGPFLALPDLSALVWLLAAYLALSGAGLLLLGRCEGRHPERARGLRRAVLTTGAGAIVFAAWLVAWRLTRNATPPRFLLIVAAQGQALACWAYLAVIARRLPGRRLPRLLRALALATTVAGIALVLNGDFMWYIAMFRPWSRHVIALTLFLLIYPPTAAGVFIYLAQALRRASREATKSWEPQTSTPTLKASV